MFGLGSPGLNTNVQSGGITPSGVALRFPTGQQWTSYRTGDEGWRRQNGWYDYSVPSNPEVISQLDDSLGTNYFWQLLNPLSVGGVSNTLRFVDVNGVQDWGAADNVDCITIDKFTGLGIYRKDIPAGGLDWAGHIDGALAFSVVVQGVTFDSFFMMSQEEYIALFGFWNFGVSKLTDPITSKRYYVGVNNGYFLSTTRNDVTTQCMVNAEFNYLLPVAKATVGYTTSYVFDARTLISV